MNLLDIYHQMAYGELRKLFIGGHDIALGDQGPQTSQYPKLLPNVVLGLTSLYTKCNLKEQIEPVTLVDGTQSYVIAPTHVDLLKINKVEGVYLEDIYEIPLNEVDNREAIRTPAYNSLFIPNDSDYAPWLLETTTLNVTYRADHPKIDVAKANAAPIITTIELPQSHLEALLLFVASRIHNPIGMTPGSVHEGNNYAMKYEIAVQALNDGGFRIDNDEENTRLRNNGWA